MLPATYVPPEHDIAIKTERVEARISSYQKQILAVAAKLQGRSLTDFVLASAQEAAVRTIQEHHSIQLTLRDRQAFFAEIENPREPSQRMKEAAARYRDYKSKRSK